MSQQAAPPDLERRPLRRPRLTTMTVAIMISTAKITTSITISPDTVTPRQAGGPAQSRTPLIQADTILNAIGRIPRRLRGDRGILA